MKKEYTDLKRFKSLHEYNEATYIHKNARYGDSFKDTYAKLGSISALTRMTDKLNRITTLILNPQNGGDESLVDSLMDLSNYCIMTVIEIERNRKQAPDNDKKDV